jgi:ribosomal protein L37E
VNAPPKPVCARCGHSWGVHQHYTAATYCGTCGSADCHAYRKPRWWRRKPPEPAVIATRPAPGPRTITAPRMTIGHQHGGLAALINKYNCGCVFTWDDTTKTWIRKPCPAAQFEEHWKGRLAL